MRDVIVNIAMSLDGRIVDENNKYAWIKGDGNTAHDTEKQFDFDQFIDSCDTLIFGKTAYDDIPLETLEAFTEKRIIVFTHSPAKPDRENVEFYQGDLSKLVQTLLSQEGENIWVWGGSSVCNILIKDDLIDKYVIGIIPMIVGKGTRLFHDDNPMRALSLEECTVNEGITMNVYTRRQKHV